MFQKPEFFDADLDAIPTGLKVVHTPERVLAEHKGRSGREFTWTYKTAVSTDSEAEMIAFGAFGWRENDWVFTNYTRAAFTTKDFADWYACPDGKLQTGRTYADASNWSGSSTLRAAKAKWIFIARTPDGQLIKGEAIVESLAQVKAEPAKAKTSIHPEIREMAERFRSIALEKTGAQLNFDERGVMWLDAYIVQHRKSSQNPVFLNIAGCFFGECIRETFGGEWCKYEESGQWMLKFEEKSSVFPFVKLQKHVENEEGDSIYGLFQLIRPMFLNKLPGSGGVPA